jgi:hypothetical protein
MTLSKIFEKQLRCNSIYKIVSVDLHWLNDCLFLYFKSIFKKLIFLFNIFRYFNVLILKINLKNKK